MVTELTGDSMRKVIACFTCLVSVVAVAQLAAAADMPVKALPPAAVAPGGFFFSVTGRYFFDDPHHDIFISPNNGGGGGVNCCGSGLGDGWGTRGVVGYRWAAWDVAVAGGYAKFSQGKLHDSYLNSGPPFQHAPKGHYWFVDGEFGYNTVIDVLKARVFVGPRFVRWKVHDQDSQVGLPFTFDSKTEAVGPRVGFALSGPFLANIGWMAEGSFSYLFGDITGTVGGQAPVASLKVDRNIKNAELRGGFQIPVWTASKLTIGYQAEYWNGALPKHEYDGNGNPLVGGRATSLHHGPFARFTYGM